jgi:hypothetical protein
MARCIHGPLTRYGSARSYVRHSEAASLISKGRRACHTVPCKVCKASSWAVMTGHLDYRDAESYQSEGPSLAVAGSPGRSAVDAKVRS